MTRFSTESLNFVCPRRELPGKLLAIALALLLPERQPKVPVTPTEAQQPKPQPELLVTPTEVQPKFKIGDLVASDWEPDEEDDDAPDSATDFGEVLGMRWLPEAESGLAPNTWVYYVRWTHSTSGSYSCYLCYDGEPSRGCDLRLVTSAKEICKH